MAIFPQPNPFLMPHIIEAIVGNKCFKNSDLLNLRLVSEDWNRAATDRCKLRLYLKNREDIPRIEKAIELFQHPDANLPVIETIKLNTKLFESTATTTREVQALIGKFLSCVSNQVEKLTIKQTSTDVGHMTTFEDDCYPVLRFTRLKDFRFVALNVYESSQLFLMHLSQKVLLSSPVLRILDIERFNTSVAHDEAEKGLGYLVLQHIPPSVQRLAVFGSLTRTDFQAFGHLQLPKLTHVTVDLNCAQGETDAMDIYNMFSNKKDELQVLRFHLAFDIAATSLEFKLPHFPALVNLELGLRALQSAHYPPPPAFPLSFPRVRQLVIEYDPSEEVVEALFPTGFLAPEVSSLSWKANSFLTMKPSVILKLTQGFLNLHTLSLQDLKPSLASGLAYIFQGCQQLKHLAISFSAHDDEANVNLDSVLTGIPSPILELVQNVLNLGWTRLELQQLKINHGLSDLKCLTDLEIESSGCSQHTVQITNFTALFGFLEMQNLESLITSKFQMSNIYIAMLQARFGKDFMLAEEGMYNPNNDNLDHSDYESDSDDEDDVSDSDSEGGDDGEDSDEDSEEEPPIPDLNSNIFDLLESMIWTQQ